MLCAAAFNEIHGVHDADGGRVCRLRARYGAVLRAERGEVFGLGLRVAEQVVFAGGQVHAVKRGRGFLSADEFGVGGKIGGFDFAVFDGQPGLAGQVFAFIQGFLRGLGEHGFDLRFEAAVAVVVQRHRHASGVFQFQAVHIGGEQVFQAV